MTTAQIVAKIQNTDVAKTAGNLMLRTKLENVDFGLSDSFCDTDARNIDRVFLCPA